ncbi:NADP-dependent oxidoreductase [Fodinicola acaciae]|uniref:NADP-dependent oxidoreductase n=1 Tax=Fodinicola acaciae TaxID=2681555 RepID=UPI0013D2CB0E|nr:NADP-dependent oxidoreductase [Fodinicola acaciae]
MTKAVRFREYGDIDVLQVVDVPRPTPGPGQLLVEVKAAGINPGEAMIRKGALHERWPATFPSGQGSDLAGVVAATGDGVSGINVGDEVIGFVENRSSHAEYTVVEAANVTPKPADVSWEAAGGLYVVGTTAYAAVAAVNLKPGDTVAVSGAAGGVGSVVVQLARNAGASVIGIAGEANHSWLTEHAVVPVAYGEGVAQRILAAAGGKLDAFIDTYGADYVDIAVEELGVRPERVDTIINFAAVEKHGVKADGNAAASTADVLAELAELIVAGKLKIPVAATYPLERVQDAFRELEKRHTRGKLVLVP